MKNRSLLLIVMAFLVGPIAFASTAAGEQDNPWRWERPSPSLRSLPAIQRFWDLKRIRALNLELKQAVSPSAPLDLKFVAKSAEEINQRAKRLKSNLSLPKPKRPNRKKVEANLDELRASLPMLESAITDFVDQPGRRKCSRG